MQGMKTPIRKTPNIGAPTIPRRFKTRCNKPLPSMGAKYAIPIVSRPYMITVITKNLFIKDTIDKVSDIIL